MRALSSTRSRVAAADLAEELDGESTTFDADRVVGSDAAQLARRSVGGERSWGARLRPVWHNTVWSRQIARVRCATRSWCRFARQPQHRRVVLERDRPQLRVPQRDDRGGAGVVRVGLVAACVVEQPRPRRERRRHIEHGLAGRDELLGQQRAGAGRAFDRPTPRFEPRRERQQSIALRTIRAHADLTDETARGHRAPPRCATPLCGSIPMMNTTNLLDDHRWETPRRAILKRVVPFLFRATPQPRSGGRPVRSKANRERWQGILETAHRTPRRYGTDPPRLHRSFVGDRSRLPSGTVPMRIPRWLRILRWLALVPTALGVVFLFFAGLWGGCGRPLLVGIGLLIVAALVWRVFAGFWPGGDED